MASQQTAVQERLKQIVRLYWAMRETERSGASVRFLKSRFEDILFEESLDSAVRKW